MSYARWSEDSDVYVFYNTGDMWECCHCRLNGTPSTVMTETPGEMADHLREHLTKGQKVPEGVIEALSEEQKDYE